MTNSKLALYGGTPVRIRPFPKYNSIGKEEVKAAVSVLKNGKLSPFVGRYCDNFWGGDKIRELEEGWADIFSVSYAISFNSATSGLIASLGALGIGPGDEVIVSPLSMCISATAPLFFNAIPIFADLEADTFCLSPQSIEKVITPRTRAILSVDTFGQSADMKAIMQIASKYKLKVLSDAAHVLGARYYEHYAGTLGDIGVYSLNYHKIIQCGEGGIAVTNSKDLALRLQLIRNHAEAIVKDIKEITLINMLGQNYRLTELSATIAIEQLKKLPNLLAQRQANANYLSRRLAKIESLAPPKIRKGCEHTYYLYPILYDEKIGHISRKELVARVRAEGIPLGVHAEGYMDLLYHMPIFSKQTIYAKGCPFKCPHTKIIPEYTNGLCPTAEELRNKRLIVTGLVYPPLNTSDMDDIVEAFQKALSA